MMMAKMISVSPIYTDYHLEYQLLDPMEIDQVILYMNKAYKKCENST